MKNSIIKFRRSIIALLMIVLSGVGASASTPWAVNPGDYRYDMSLYLEVSFLATGKMDYSQYVVAAFCGDECRGVAQVLPLPDGGECLYLRARSNQETGETMTFKYYNMQTEEILPIDGVSFPFESNGRLGYPSTPYEVTIIRHYDVSLSAGPGGAIDAEGGRIAEGTELTVTATPAEGYHFEKWSDDATDNPRTILVDGDITLTAQFAVNTYKLTYMVDGETYKEADVDFATAITPEVEPTKEGYTFSGWDEVPETMPAHDVTVSGTFTINSYSAVFKIGEDVIDTKTVVFGEPVVAPEAPAKEGHTFAGWQDMPETMPAHNIEVLGSYTVNTYKLTYMVDGETYKEADVDFGATITPEVEPTKEGYTFSGWDEVPETMPAHDVTVSGTFSINTYLLTVYLNDEVILSDSIEYGRPVSITTPEVPEGMKFDGWQETVPETMPAHDVDIHGTYSLIDAISSVVMDADARVTVCTLNGCVIFANAKWADVRTKLGKGLYIINGRKHIIMK